MFKATWRCVHKDEYMLKKWML